MSLCLCFSNQAIAASTPESVAIDLTKKMYSGDAAGVIQLFNMENYDQAIQSNDDTNTQHNSNFKQTKS